MADTPPEYKYDYDGWLVFNGNYSVNIDDEGAGPQDLIENFDRYTEPAAGTDEKGYVREEFDQELAQAGDLTWALHRFAENLYSFEYQKTTWDRSEGYQRTGDTSTSTFWRKNEGGGDVFWDTERDLMVFRGQKKWINDNQDDLRNGLSEEMQLEELTFDLDFFLWILYREDIGKGLTNELSVREISNVETTDVGVSRPESVSFEGRSDVLQSAEVLTSLLQERKPKSLQGTFVLDSNLVEAEVRRSGKIHVYVSENEMEGLAPLRRMGVSLRFVFEFLRQYRTWCGLEPKRKYPPESFFKNLAKNLKKSGFDPEVPVDKLAKEYKMKREGEFFDDGTPSSSGRDAP